MSLQTCTHSRTHARTHTRTHSRTHAGRALSSLFHPVFNIYEPYLECGSGVGKEKNQSKAKCRNQCYMHMSSFSTQFPTSGERHSRECPSIMFHFRLVDWFLKSYNVQRNPAIAHFKGPVNFMPDCERCLIANI